MRISKLRVQNFRIHSDFSIKISPKSTLISGKNGSGKTSLIEAIYFALQGTSFRSSDKEIIKNDGSEWLRVDLFMDDGIDRVVKIKRLSDGRISKILEIDGKKTSRMPISSKIPVILFEPDDLRILNGSPSRRRDFIDRFLSQIFPQFQLSLYRYSKALKHRNKLLKKDNIEEDEIFPWNLMLAEFGAEIISYRIDFIQTLNEKITQVYREISGVNDDIKIIYKGNNTSKEEIMKIMLANFGRDKILGYTSFGPHNHDISFEFNGKDARNISSRGENRSLVLALKFIETDFLAEMSSKSPVVLLDDVFSELDKNRQKMLTAHFSKYQTIISSVENIEVEDSIIHNL